MQAQGCSFFQEQRDVGGIEAAEHGFGELFFRDESIQERIFDGKTVKTQVRDLGI